MRSPLSSERWTRIEGLFVEAAQREPAERARFLEAECGDDRALMDEVLSLLHHDTEEPVGIESVHAGAASILREESLTGATLGPWRVEREIGRGGMSVVYLAVRADGQFARRVAIKLIKRGMDTAAVIERLRRERRILAALDHPHIARLLDGGTTPDGLPYIVMDYVEGLPLDRWCDEQGLGIDERCELMRKVCDAVAYAHRMLVIHRDLKPGNILVGEDGNPKLLDFGIAKVLSDDSQTGAAPDTRGTVRPLTPEYASPEQLAGSAVGTAADVYSLGVVLFELLTGVRPRGESDRASSTALRKGKPQRWAKRLTGDLDNILQMALRTEPERRYPGAGQLGEDLRLHLAGMPVIAREETLVYQWGKFLKRHRTGAAIALILGVLLTAGAALYIREARLAAKRFEDLHQFASSFLFGVDDQLRDTPDPTAARAIVAQKALAYLNGLAVEKSDDSKLRREAGNAWKRLGDLQGDPLGSSLGQTAAARASYRKAVAILEPLALTEFGPHAPDDIRSDLVGVYVQLSRLERVAGDNALARSIVARALDIARNTGSPPNPELQADLGQVLVEYAWALEMEGKIPEAKEQVTAAISLLENAARQNPVHRPDLAHALSMLAATEVDLGDYGSVLAHLKRSLAIRQELNVENPRSRTAQRNLMMAWGAIGDVEIDQASGRFFDPAAGAASYGQMVAVGKQLVESDESDRTARMDLAIGLESVGDALSFSGKPRAAIAELEESLAAFDDLKRADAANRRIDENRSFLLRRLGEQHLKLGETGPGREALQQAISISSSILERDPTNEDLREYMLWEMEALADSLADGHDGAAALALVPRIEATAREVGAHATAEARRSSVPDAWEKVGVVYAKLNDPASARVWYRRSLDAWAAMEPLSAFYAPRPARVKERLSALGAVSARQQGR